ncbi:MAG TPA: hypothetical protein VGM29_15670, partial [Polyangiaceae bacterium]
MREHRNTVITIALAALTAVVAFALFGSGGGDDSHITWWVADEFARTGRIRNLNLLPLEQSSSLALVILAGVVKRIFHARTPAAGVVLSLLAGVLTAWCGGRICKRIDARLQIPGALLIATTAPLAYWATS